MQYVEQMQTLDYLEECGERIFKETLAIKAMLLEANERGTDVDIGEFVKRFSSMGEHGKALMKINSDIARIKSDLYGQGVVMTNGDFLRRIFQMTYCEF